MNLTVDDFKFKDEKILQLMQDYCEAVVEAKDYSSSVDRFFEQQTVAGREEKSGSAPSASVSRAGVGAGGEGALLLEGL